MSRPGNEKLALQLSRYSMPIEKGATIGSMRRDTGYVRIDEAGARPQCSSNLTRQNFTIPNLYPMDENLEIDEELAAMAGGMSDWYRAAFKAGRERIKGLDSTLTAFLAGAVWARRWPQSGAPKQEPRQVVSSSDGGFGESLVAAIEGDYARMRHSDLVLTCRMLERGRGQWRVEAEELKATLVMLKRELDPLGGCAVPADVASLEAALSSIRNLRGHWLRKGRGDLVDRTMLAESVFMDALNSEREAEQSTINTL